MADVSEAEGDREVPICPSIPSGEQTVWADASTLLQLACNGIFLLLITLFEVLGFQVLSFYGKKVWNVVL